MNKFASLFALALASCGVVPPNEGRAPSQAEERTWRDVERVNNADAYRHYLGQYPNGSYAYIAAQRLKNPVDEVPLTPVRQRRGNNFTSNSSSSY